MTGSLQTKGNKFYAVLNVKNEKGIRKQKWIDTGYTIRGNKKNAEKVLQKLIEEWEEKDYRYCNMLVSDYFLQWLDQIKLEVAPNTYRSYYGNMKNHIIPYFKKKR